MQLTTRICDFDPSPWSFWKAKSKSSKSQILGGNCFENTLQKQLKEGRSKNTLSSDFVKHSSNLGGSGVDFGAHFEGAFGAKNALDSTSEAGF